jgi:hypothetical protein
MGPSKHGGGIQTDAVLDLLVAETLRKEVSAVLILEKLVIGFESGETAAGGSRSKVLSNLASSQRALNGLVFYLFERRYGWSEVVDGLKPEIDTGKTTDSDIFVQALPEMPVLQDGKSLSCGEDEKKAINRAIDNLLRDLTFAALPPPAAEGDSLSLVQALEIVAMHTQRPVVRRQTIFYFFDWLDKQIKSTSGIPDLEHVLLESRQVENLCLAGLMDMWSAIRKGSASRLALFSDILPVKYIARLWDKIEKVCLADSNAK